MSRARTATSILASPTLVGAVTILITLVAVFLAYNANKGLPFIPTYNITAEVPDGANLVEGNEVRIGGFRVGAINEIQTKTITQRGQTRAIALLEMKLDKVVEPLAVDSRIAVRPRSTLGLKYLELTPGTSPEMIKPGETLQLAQSTEVTEIDDFLNVFDSETRENSQVSLQGFGDALAGRGMAINEFIAEAGPLVESLEPVARNLSSDETDIDNFFRQLGATSAQVAPVAETQAELFSNLADTLEAIGRSPEALRQTIEKSPPTLDTGIQSFRFQRPFLAELADASRQLRPAVNELPLTLPRIGRAVQVGTPVLARSPALNQRLEDVLEEVEDVGNDPDTGLALTDLSETLSASGPLVGGIAPYQTVCNYPVYFFTYLSDHVGAPVQGGTAQRVTAHNDNGVQDDRVSDDKADRPADVPSNQDPTTAQVVVPPVTAFPGGPAGLPVPIPGAPLPFPQGVAPTTKLNTQYVASQGKALTPGGGANCGVGQTGYLDGPVVRDPRYPPSPDPDRNGGSSVVIENPTPAEPYGPTFTGVDRVQDLP
jgi:virulence factor Mce-like protein